MSLGTERSRLRVVLDTNVVLPGVANPAGASGKVIAAVDSRELVQVTSNRLNREYVRTLTAVSKRESFRHITPERIRQLVERMNYLGERPRVGRRGFEFSRDPTDAELLQLAIAGSARLLLTFDRDLLSLTDSHEEPARRFRRLAPGCRILTPDAWLAARLPAR